VSDWIMKALGLLLLVGGEVIAVYSEMVAAKAYAQGGERFLGVFGRNTALMTVAGAMLIAGYMVCYSSFRNIWLVSVVSVTAILIVEPGLTYFVFQELPGRGATIGLVLGVLGFIATLVG
jgi:CHASE2 domain-containing sensor protein